MTHTQNVLAGQALADHAGICARCAERYPTCCRIEPGTETSCFPISPEEQGRLVPHAAALGVPPCIEEPNSEIFVQAMHKLFPGRREQLRQAFPKDHYHLRLQVSTDGSCLFLGRTGCILPIVDRPYYCRLYPFWFINAVLFTFTSPKCLAMNSSSSTAGLCALFNIDPSALHTLHESLRNAWGLNADEPRPK